ncbi:MAG: EthD domain-containing protein [Pseudomonadota bacterium]
MFKTCVFLNTSTDAHAPDPFRYRDETAAAECRALCPDVAGYTQTRALADQVEPGAAPAFAGVAELYFQEPQQALAVGNAPERLAPLLEGGSDRIGPVITGLTRTVMRLPAHLTRVSIKGVFPFRRKAELTVEAFQRYWWQHHGPIAALTEEALCYLQCHPLEATYGTERPAYDGITELHWPDVEAARRSMASRQMQEDQAGDAVNFVDLENVLLFLAEEEAVIAT